MSCRLLFDTDDSTVLSELLDGWSHLPSMRHWWSTCSLHYRQAARQRLHPHSETLQPTCRQIYHRSLQFPHRTSKTSFSLSTSRHQYRCNCWIWMGAQSAHFHRCPTSTDVLQRCFTSGHLYGMWHASDRSESGPECHCPGRLQFDPMRTECRWYSWFASFDRCGWSRLVLYNLRYHWGALHTNLCVIKKSWYAMADRISWSARLCRKNRRSSQDPRTHGTISGK